MQKNKPSPFPHTIQKIYSRQIIDLNIKTKTINLEVNKYENLCALGLGKSFLDMTPKAFSIKEKIDKLEFIKTEKFFFQRTF